MAAASCYDGVITTPSEPGGHHAQYPQALARIKGNLPDLLPDATLHRLCRDLQLSYRNRRLTPVVTAHLFLRQILEGNAPVPELRRLAKIPFAESSYCVARQRLPLSFFQRLNHAVLDRCRRFSEEDPRARWYGHRVFFLDG